MVLAGPRDPAGLKGRRGAHQGRYRADPHQCALGNGRALWPLAVPRMSVLYHGCNTLGLMLAAAA